MRVGVWSSEVGVRKRIVSERVSECACCGRMRI